MTRAWRCTPLVMVILVACGSGSTDADSGSGRPDSGRRADASVGIDASAGEDGGSESDAGERVDGGSQCGCIEEPLRWDLEGGFRAFEGTDEVEVCRTYVYTRREPGGGAVIGTCTNEVPCNGDVVTISELNAALAHADVVAAFEAAPILYGRDLRPVDAPLFQITYAGDTIQIGSPCAAEGGCTPIPPGVEALRDLLIMLEGERLDEEDCASMF
jgi:hypothetical protein